MVESEVVLRSALVAELVKWTGISGRVADAMRTVPRHVFVPQVPVETAYSNSVVVTRRDSDGVAMSSASAPSVVAMMLEQLDVQHGQRVLEIGAGTGYNAGLLSQLVGPQGHVTTVEITADVAADARRALAAAAATGVDVVCGDGEYAHAPNSPYDKIIATAGVWQIPQAWADQLTDGGVLVVPLRLKGFTRSIAFTRSDGVWRSRSSFECGFMPITGDGSMPERTIALAADLTVRFDDGYDANAEALQRAAAGPGVVQWTGIQIDQPLDMLDYWLADIEGYCRILASGSVTARGLAEPLNDWGSMGTATDAAVGYITKRTNPDNPYLFELGACAYGPAAQDTVEQLVERIRAWNQARQSMDGVRIEVHPSGQGDASDAIMIVDKQHCRIIVRPQPRSAG